MTDVRLTALNPEDSKVYPVACNSSGELITTKSGDINLDVPGNLDVGGAITAGGVRSNEGFVVYPSDDNAYALGIRNAADNMWGAYITATGSAVFAGGKAKIVSSGRTDIGSDGTPIVGPALYGVCDVDEAYWAAANFRNTGTGPALICRTAAGSDGFRVESDGSGTFSGEVVIGSRGQQWLIRESNGVAMLVEKTRRVAEVRDLPRELDLVEAALSEIMEKLKMTPPAGWPVWDGSDNSQ